MAYYFFFLIYFTGLDTSLMNINQRGKVLGYVKTTNNDTDKD